MDLESKSAGLSTQLQEQSLLQNGNLEPTEPEDVLVEWFYNDVEGEFRNVDIANL